MSELSLTLLAAAAGLGLTHTLLGPDHYLPFVLLARARRWSLPRTLVVTGLCGLGHVLGSILLGGVGLAIGAAVAEIEAIELGRGDWAAWALIAFGVAYGAWGLRHAIRRRRGLEPHDHGGHVHVHDHGGGAHVHGDLGHETQVTFWPLFIAFVLGPCEPLIPLFLVPASRGDWRLAGVTALVFGVVTVATMVAVTALAVLGLRRLQLGPLERWSHLIAGVVVALSGLAIITLGL